jgi:hypothetical protein
MKRIKGNHLWLFIIFSEALFFISLCYGFEVSKTSTGADIKWQNPSETIYVNPDGGPAGSLSAAIAAMQTWTDVVTSSFVFNYGGTTSKTVSDYGSNDGTNIIVFGPMGQNGTLAENTFWFYPSSGRMIDSDIQINTSYPYATDGSAASYDVQSLLTHEMGHSLSLADLYSSADREKTMYGYGFKGDLSKRTLHQDDMDGITYLYPGSSMSPPSVQTGSASSVTSSSATLGGSVNPNGLSTTYYFEYGTSSSYGLTTPLAVLSAGSSDVEVSAKVTGLMPNVIYFFRVVAVSAAGTTYGGQMSFLTPRPARMPWLRLLLLDDETVGVRPSPAEPDVLPPR